MAVGRQEEVYNILPIHDVVTDHPSLRFPEVRAAMAALRAVGELRKAPFTADPPIDILEWLGSFFGFQRDNVRNQREHLVLLLANAQMRLPNPDSSESLDPSVVRRLRRKLLANYTSWCAFLRRASNVWVSDRGGGGLPSDPRRELLYVALYLLIWGEAANLRFVPECLCYIFHHLAGELNRILEGYIDENTGAPALPAVHGENAFLTRVVTPLYEAISREFKASRNGTAPHSDWRNYDDFNEYFWSDHCFHALGWPLNLSSNFFVAPPDRRRVGKTGFVEQRSFWNIYRCFDRLWVMLVLYLQFAIVVAWYGDTYPWQALAHRDVQVRALTVFATWAGLRFLQSLTDWATQYKLLSRETKLPALRMALKSAAAAAWVLVFVLLYGRIWDQRDRDKSENWSKAANARVLNFLEAALVFVVPELLGLVLFLIPGFRRLLERSNWKLLDFLTWWFQSRIFVGRGLWEGPVDSTLYSLFWLATLAVKFIFSYFLQIKPMIAPTKSILALRKTDYQWYQPFNAQGLGVGLLWLPVVLIYMMDLQIWYSIASSLVGALVGLFAHLGEIRNVQQLRLRFQFFASAMQFNLMPEDQLVPTRTIGSRFRNAVQRMKLRYGLGRLYEKIESNQLSKTRFQLVWNEVIAAFREEDIISNREEELLEMPPRRWGIRVIRWPCFLLSNELQAVLLQVKESKPKDQKLWKKICKHEYRRCTVIEAYDSVKFLLLNIVKQPSDEHTIVSSMFDSIDDAIRVGRFTEEYKMSALQHIHKNLVALTELLAYPKKDSDKKLVNTLQSLYETVKRDFPIQEKGKEEIRRARWVPSEQDSSKKLLFEDAVELPGRDNLEFYRQVRRLHAILSSKDSIINVPKNLDARHRIAFFSNSLFMNIPRAPLVEKMKAFSVLTPYYEEEVLFTRDQIDPKNEDGISILFYLQKIYADEWENFVERMMDEGLSNRAKILVEKTRDVQLWASLRGQTLTRTVRGMMYYYRALKMLAFLDTASETDMHEQSQELTSFNSDDGGVEMGESGRSSHQVSIREDVEGRSPFEGHIFGTALMKFTYVVACQLYATQKKDKDKAVHAAEILNLMKNNEALRVAYADEVNTERGYSEYYSVLVKYDQQLEREVEIYRVRLPGPLKLGEGKPENQNHAIIFTRGDAVQTIDMNQDNYFEEALKMRNLLEEFTHTYGVRKPTILGVREHIFTGSVSSLAWFMSSQETSFVTLGQRVLANPLKVRMHYGHPDVFDRLWFLSRGGISKGSKVINISEDIFAGFNCTLRGGNVTHHEYIQVGKGRDVGLNQISLFEAKVSSGNGEQVSSRDVYRLGHRLDFFRMLSFFYSSVGFYFNTLLVVLTVFAFVWGRLYLALSGLEGAIAGAASSNAALGSILNQQFIIQLGLFTALPMIVENSLEHGFVSAVWDFIKMQLQLGAVFFTFSMGTRSHFFGRTVLHGGAKYQATGRGFVVEHTSFCDNYRQYARSHFTKAIELALVLTVYASYSPVAKSSFVYIALTISSWFLVLSWLLAPFLFNPLGFEWLKTVDDFDEFMNWIWYYGCVSTTQRQSWETWWYAENDHLRKTGLMGRILETILVLRFFFFQYGIVFRLNIANGSESIGVYLLSWIYIVVSIGVFLLVGYARDKYAAKEHIYYRAVQSLIVVSTVLVIILLAEFTHFTVTDIFTSLLAFIPTGWGLISVALVIRPFLQKYTMVWESIVSIARVYEILLGMIVMVPVVILAWTPGFQSMQTKLLFNEAFSRGLEISRILVGKKITGKRGKKDGEKKHAS